MTADTTTEATASPSPAAPPVTCGTPDCLAAFLDGYSYASTWDKAVGLRWGTDATGQRRCPACMAARVPAPGMYVVPADLRAWIDALYPEPGAALEAPAERMAAEGPVPAVPPVPTAPAVPLVPAVRAIPEPPAGSVAELAADLHMAPAPDLGPEREKNLAKFLEAHQAEAAGQDAPAECDCQADPAETTQIPAQSAETEAIPAITADTEGAQS